MKTALLDVNVLTALLWPAHEHHDAAHRWFAARATAHWATCSLTQLGFLRIVSNPAFSRDALTPGEALTLLDANLSPPEHEFWADTMPVPAAVRGMETALQGYRQLTDAYLLAFAHRRKAVVATFDRGMRTLAGERYAATVEIVSAR